MKNNFFKIIYVALFAMLLLSVSSCKKYLEIDGPTNSLLWQEPLTSQLVVDKVVTNTYSLLSFALGSTYMPLFLELLSDNYTTPAANPAIQEVVNNAVKTDNSFICTPPWTKLYKAIYSANKMIEVLPSATVSTQLTQAGINQAMADAYTIRAISYFFLVRMYGNVPLCLSSDVVANSQLAQSTQDAVFAQVEKDLLAAQALAATAKPAAAIYFRSQNQISALLAKLYLHWGKWTQASAAASNVINATTQYTTTTIANAYFRPSKEIIVALGNNTIVNTNNTNNVPTAFTLLYTPTSASSAVSAAVPTTDLLSSYPSGDLRRSTWFGTGFGKTLEKKYPYTTSQISGALVPAGQEQDAVLATLPEMYLIRAEAKANLGDLQGAADDLLVVRTRAGLGAVPVVDKPTMITAILNERRWELNPSFGERWFDLCRTNNVVTVLGNAANFPGKATTITANSKFMPIPTAEIQLNPNLVQNPGY